MGIYDDYKLALLKAKTGIEQNGLWIQYLVNRHLRDNGDLQIFHHVFRLAKEKYCILRNNYYWDKITKKEYLVKRMGNDGIFFYDAELFRLGLAIGKTSQAYRDEIGWKGLKIERQDLPIDKIPYKGFVRSEGTIRLLLEGCDYIHKNLVPTLSGNWKLREPITAGVDDMDAYEYVDYLTVNLTAKEIANFEDEKK